MEKKYDVYFGNRLSGTVWVAQQGLYYRFRCRCQLSGDVICRLVVNCGDIQENLGVVVPVEGGFGLETKVPAKRFGKGNMTFSLVTKSERTAGKFAPIYPEEPFAYISRLKDAYLVRQNGQAGICIE